MYQPPLIFFFFFFNDTATTEIYTLSLHDALPISGPPMRRDLLSDHVPSLAKPSRISSPTCPTRKINTRKLDRKSTRLNSSHSQISYAVFCLKKKKTNTTNRRVGGTILGIKRLPRP